MIVTRIKSIRIVECDKDGLTDMQIVELNAHEDMHAAYRHVRRQYKGTSEKILSVEFFKVEEKASIVFDENTFTQETLRTQRCYCNFCD